MSEKITIYQKPTCSKCRTVSKLLQERGLNFEAIDYYERPLTAEQIHELLKKLGISAHELLRRDEPIARELGIGKKHFSEEELVDLMVKYPDLIQRPIVVRGSKAVLARPTENVRKLL